MSEELTGHGVGAGGQDEDQRDGAVGVQVAPAEVEGRRLDELLAQVAGDVLSDGGQDLIGPQAAHNDHLLQRVELVAPRRRQSNFPRLPAVVD